MADETGLTLEHLRDWLERYFQAWVSNDPGQVEGLFSPDATYWTDPFEEPQRGVTAIVAAWVAGVQHDVEYAFEPLAVTGKVGIAHWRVTSRRPGSDTRDVRDGVLVLTFAANGRCVEHREWMSHRRLPASAP